MSSSEKTSSTRRIFISGRALALISLLFVVGFVIYSEAMKGPFIYDDDLYISNNTLIFRLDNFLVLPFNRYITFLSFALNYAVTGLNPFDFHAVNVLIHIINSVLVYALIIAIFKTPRMNGRVLTGPSGEAHAVAAAASLIFLSHPMQTQAVTYVTQRFASLATLFYLLATVFYLDYRLQEQASSGSRLLRRALPYGLSLFFVLVAQFTKEICFTLPAVIVLIEAVFFNARDEVGGLKKRLVRLAPFLAVLAVLPFVFLSSQWIDIGGGIAQGIRKEQVVELKNLSSYDYLMTQFRVIVMYLRLLVWPVGQRLFYDIPLYTSLFIPSVLVSFIFLASIFSLGVYLCFARRSASVSLRPLVGFGILWFFITISVESSIVPIRHLIFEHRVYLSSVGALLAAAAFLYYVFDYLRKSMQGHERVRWPWWMLVSAIVIALSIATYNRNMFWTDRLIFWTDVAAKAPRTQQSYINLGAVYFDRGEYEKAIDNYGKAIQLNPGDPKAYTNMAGSLAMLGRLDEAEEACLKSIELAPGSHEGYLNLGTVFFKRKDYESALINFQKALSIKPAEVTTIKNMAVVFEETGRIDEAIEWYKEALKIAPHETRIYITIGRALKLKGRDEEAAFYFKEADRLKPRY